MSGCQPTVFYSRTVTGTVDRHRFSFSEFAPLNTSPAPGGRDYGRGTAVRLPSGRWMVVGGKAREASIVRGQSVRLPIWSEDDGEGIISALWPQAVFLQSSYVATDKVFGVLFEST